MKHREFLKALKAEKSFLKWLFKSKQKRELKIKELIRKRYGYLEGKFCKIENVYYYIVEVGCDFTNPKQSILIKTTLMRLHELRSSMMKELRGFHLCAESHIGCFDVQKIESNLISKEEFFNHIKSLVAEMESNF
nr:MAG TPA: hypothetical protein [Caudoviricetes sp.]